MLYSLGNKTEMRKAFKWKGGGLNMMKSMQQKADIRTILTEAKKNSGRTQAEIIAWSEGSFTRSTWYKALKGQASDERMICMFMAVLAPAALFDKYCRACGISISDEYEGGRLLRSYITKHDRRYDVLDINAILVNAGQPPIIKTKAA